MFYLSRNILLFVITIVSNLWLKAVVVEVHANFNMGLFIIYNTEGNCYDATWGAAERAAFLVEVNVERRVILEAATRVRSK